MGEEAETEADTCRLSVTPRLQKAGWDQHPHRLQEQRTITPGRILFSRSGTRRARARRLDYLLRYRPDLPIAVVEAKAAYRRAADGMQQAKLYAEMLGLKFAYATNGAEILEYDFFTGAETARADFPTPDELWARQRAGLSLSPAAEDVVLTPGRPDPQQPLRYYQEAAVTRAVEAIASGRRRTLLTLCTGSGKTPIAFQIAWRLHAARWTAIPGRLRARILFLADRDVLVKDPQNRHFAPFGQARHRILAGQGARRERLRPEALLAEEWPMPSVAAQEALEPLMEKARAAVAVGRAATAELDKLIPALLYETFGAEVAAVTRAAAA